MMIRTTVLMVGLSVLVVLAGFPSLAKSPPAAVARLYGVWEGVEFEEPRVIVMSLQEGMCVIVMTAGAPGRVLQTIFKARDFSVGKDGELTIVARSDDGEQLRVHGKPKLLGTDGILEAAVRYWPA